jgi:molybdopterin molybdotransferase
LASIGKDEVLVEKLPVISIITTGDEVVNVDAAVNPVQIRNSNSHVLKALLKKWNIISRSCVHVSDQLQEIETAVRSVMTSDIIIMCGGVSAGDADHVPAVLSRLGVKNIFHKVAIKPGKPIWFGKSEAGSIVFALPGNPLSCLVTCKIFVERFLSYSFGLGESPKLKLPLNGERFKKGDLDEFFPVRISGSPSRCEVVPFNGSGDITAAIYANALAIHPCTRSNLSHGTIVDAYPLS